MIPFITGAVGLLLGVLLGAVYADDLFFYAQLARVWLVGMLSLAGLGAVAWALGHFALHLI